MSYNAGEARHPHLFSRVVLEHLQRKIPRKDIDTLGILKIL